MLPCSIASQHHPHPQTGNISRTKAWYVLERCQTDLIWRRERRHDIREQERRLENPEDEPRQRRNCILVQKALKMEDKVRPPGFVGETLADPPHELSEMQPHLLGGGNPQTAAGDQVEHGSGAASSTTS